MAVLRSGFLFDVQHGVVLHSLLPLVLLIMLLELLVLAPSLGHGVLALLLFFLLAHCIGAAVFVALGLLAFLPVVLSCFVIGVLFVGWVRVVFLAQCLGAALLLLFIGGLLVRRLNVILYIMEELTPVVPSGCGTGLT